jgi:hypothetical protein
MSAPRIKDAGFVQQHIEKMVLGGGLLIFAIAVFLFIIGNPFAVEVDRNTYDKPADAVDVLVRVDDRIETGLQETKPLPEITPPKFQEDFMAMMIRQFDLSEMVPGLGDPGATLAALTPDIPEPSRYALVYPPTPQEIEFVSGPDVLDKEFDEQLTREYFTMWGKDMQEPGDFTMFVASGEFDVWEWINRLKADPETSDDEAIKIPTGIWAQRFGIAGVALLREEFDPEQGRFTNRQIVEALPGQKRILPEFEAEPDTTQGIQLIMSLREAQLEITQPEMPWLEGFVQVTPPGGEEEGVGAGGYFQALNEENLGPAEKEILSLEQKIEQLRERQARQRERQNPDRPDRPRRERPNRGGNDAPPPGAGDFDAPRGPSSERRDPIERQITNLQERIERLRPKAMEEERNRQRLAELEQQREQERQRREALRAERDRDLIGSGQSIEGMAKIEGMNLQEGDTIRVWAADPTMEPGKTYRYKLLVAVINPLYAVPRLASDQLEENQQRAAIWPTEEEIDAMEWMGPIQVEPEYRFFFTGGGQSKADIDIYRRHKGVLRVQEFDGAPGDTIGTTMEVTDEFGQVEEIDMGLGAILVDVQIRRDALSNSTVYQMTYMDENGEIFERNHSLDKNSPVRKELRDEIEEGPEQVLRPKSDELPGEGGEFGPGFEPGFNDFR